nr:class I SAM-dependent methyltransferase [Candidatus Eremiobacteraeota bacterium]
MTPLPDAAALAALRGAGVEHHLAERLAVYAALVLAANRRLNLTGAKDGTAFAAHIADALTLAADVVGPLIDVGSGNGVPGIPLALATGARVTLLEPIKKRANFLAGALTELGLEGDAVPGRAEDVARDPAYRERFGTATARAVGSA